MEYYPFPNYPDIPSIECKNVPTVNLNFDSAKNNLGLEITDIFLWICKRRVEGNLPRELEQLTEKINISWYNDISINSIVDRWYCVNK